MISLSKNRKSTAEKLILIVKEKIEFLRQQACHYVQGYYYSKPLPEEEFIAYNKNM